MAENNLKAVVEAMLFSTDKPLTIEQIRKALDNLPSADINAVIQELKTDYQVSNRGLRINEVAGGFQLSTPVDFAPLLKKLHKGRKVEKLSRPALETLAIIAYKQPLTKIEIETLRNVNVDGVIDSLLEKDLVRVAGRRNTPGCPYVFGTTKKFLEYFGLNNLEDLPKIEELKIPENIEIEEIETQNTKTEVTENENTEASSENR
ncbi:MAG: SMC-Scp complex subunit ScpB [Candidatus Omnitrophica bacterium]|jgi:segregation and condensation protein B|nr:SMC-Scp complex subunit ScpB [Candidatus Omnitrophota bacterium]